LYAALTHLTQVFGDFRGKNRGRRNHGTGGNARSKRRDRAEGYLPGERCALEAFDYDAAGELLYHYLLIPVICAWQGGEPTAASDVFEARWFDAADLLSGDFSFSKDVVELAIKQINPAHA
jgi:hypothetical protein